MIDEKDKHILRLLQNNAKFTTKEIAGRVGLTNTPTYDRIKRLEKTGTITGYSALVNREKIGYRVLAFCSVSLQVHNADVIREFEQEVQMLPQVVECYHIAGMFDYLLKVVVKEMSDYQEFVTQKLAALKNIGKVQSSFVLTEVKEQHRINIE